MLDEKSARKKDMREKERGVKGVKLNA